MECSLIGDDAAFLGLSWSTPDSGYVLQSTSTPDDPNSWIPPGWAVTQMGSVKRVLVHSSTAVPDSTKIYVPDALFALFRMIKQ